MKINEMVLTVMAAGLLLGSTGRALAEAPNGDNSADNPFALYREAGEPANGGTVVTVPSAKSIPADQNPFALYDSPSGGTPVSASHLIPSKE